MSAACALGARATLAVAPSGRAPGKKGLGERRIHAAAVNRRSGRVGISPNASIAEPPNTDAPSTDGEKRRAKVSMVSLGCPKNTVDGEVMLGDLFANGFDVVDDHEDADAVIVNTCAFVEDAKNESVDAILAAAALSDDTEANGGKKKKIIVTGCLAQRYAEDLAAEMPEVDVIMGFDEYKNLSGALGSVLGVSTEPVDADGKRGRVRVGTASPPFRPEALRKRLTPEHYAYLRVAEGCDHKCTFCAIPGFRGKFRSKPWTPVVEEAKALAQTGAKELCLIAEDTNQWGMDLKASDGRGLAELLEALAAVDGVEMIRILYAYPSYFSEELINAIADIPQVAKYIDIPLQHITNLSLLRMNRPPRQHTEDLLYKLRDRIPGLALRTTFISGFPGETEREHEELMQFCREFKFERLGAFAYSEEDGTPASEYPDQVEQAVRDFRRDQLIEQQQRISEDFAESRVGNEVDVIIDGFNPEFDAWVGRTSLEAPDIDPIVFIQEPKAGSGMAGLEMGQMRRCKIVGTSLFDLEAHLIV
jgi:ribosomal protein S12 methylthiotransferase